MTQLLLLAVLGGFSRCLAIPLIIVGALSSALTLFTVASATTIAHGSLLLSALRSIIAAYG